MTLSHNKSHKKSSLL